MKKSAVLFLAMIMIVSLSSYALAVPGIGARAMGMGGAYTALARDITAAYYNPAGLIKAGLLVGDGLLSLGYDGNVSISDLQSLSNQEQFVQDNWEDEIDWNLGASGILGVSVRGIGISVMNFTDGSFYKGAVDTSAIPPSSPMIGGGLLMKNSIALTFGTNLSSPIPLMPSVALGANVRYVNGILKTFGHMGAPYGSAEVSMVDATGSGLALDLGLQSEVAPMVTVGLALRDLMAGTTYTGDVKHYEAIDPTTGEPINALPDTDFDEVERDVTHVVPGVAVQIPMLATLAADVDMYDVKDVGTKMDWHFGVESGIPLFFLTPRAGYYTENGGDNAKVTIGLGMGLGPVGANLAYGWDTKETKESVLVFEIGGAL